MFAIILYMPAGITLRTASIDLQGKKQLIFFVKTGTGVSWTSIPFKSTNLKTWNMLDIFELDVI